MKSELRITILAPLYGLVSRGAERMVDDLASGLRGDVSIASLAGVHERGRRSPSDAQLADALALAQRFQRRHARLDRVAGILLRDRFRPLIGSRDYYSSSALLDAEYAKTVPSRLAALRPDVVLSFGGFHTHRAARQVCSDRGTALLGHYGGAADWSMRIVARQLTHGVVVSSPKDLRFLRQKEPQSRSWLIPPGVDLSHFEPGMPSVPVPDLSTLPRPVFFCASAFDSFKRIHLLIDAVAALGRGSLALAGDGPQRVPLLAQAEQQLGPGRFQYLGVLPKPRLRDVYRSIDVYCLPSVNEPFGIVLIEAMACNRPVVATDDETRRWMIGDAGVLADAANRPAFAAALDQAAQTEWGARPRARAAYFSLDRVTDAWNALIGSTAEGKIPSPTHFEREYEASTT